MTEKEMIDIWETSSQTEQVKFEDTKLLFDLDNSMSRIDKSIRNRDIIEIGAAIFVISIFGVMSYLVPFIISKLGCLFIMIWGAYVIYKLKKVKKHKRPVDLAISLQDQLKKYKIYIVKQAEMLDNVLYWYLLPPFIGIFIIVIGVDVNSLELGMIDKARVSLLNDFVLLLKIGYLSIVVTIYIIILWSNKRAVRKTYKPIIQDLENAQRQLEDE